MDTNKARDGTLGQETIMNIKTPQNTLWQRCVDILQQVCVVSAFILFLAYVQSVTATENELGQINNATTQR